MGPFIAGGDYNLTLQNVDFRVDTNTCTVPWRKPYARESTLTPSQVLRIWPQLAL
jgi:hypothetical protein